MRLRILGLQAQVVSQSVTAAAITLDALAELREQADQRGQTGALTVVIFGRYRVTQGGRQ